MTIENIQSRPKKETMLALPQPGPSKTKESLQQDRLRASLRTQVLRALGEPADLLQVQVRPLWNDRYRVNVFRGADVTCAKVAHSYFIVADSEGNLLESNPKITKQY